MIVIANLYRLGKEDKDFSLKYKTLDRSNAKVEKAYVDIINTNYKDSGHYYEILEKETAEWNENRLSGKKLKKDKPLQENPTVTEVGKSEVKELKKTITKLKRK